MSGAPSLLERFAAGLARALHFGAAREDEQARAGENNPARPASSEKLETSDREQEERLRELQIMMATWM
jgi:hypothetical protein